MGVKKIKVDPNELLNKVCLYKDENVTLEDVIVIIECMIKEKIYGDAILRDIEITLLSNLILLIDKRNKGNA